MIVAAVPFVVFLVGLVMVLRARPPSPPSLLAIVIFAIGLFWLVFAAQNLVVRI